MRKACDNVLETLGHTPMAKLTKIVPEGAAEVYVKLENLNLGNSVKTRTAYGMIIAAEKEGLLGPNSILVEPTSGNQGVGIAQIAAIKGYQARILMPASVSEERKKLVEHYGAEVILTPVGKDIEESFVVCIDMALKMAEEDPNVVVLQQFENPANPAIHYETTGPEIYEQVDGKVDAFVAGVGTGGTVTGVGRFLKEKNPDVKIYAVEPSTAAIMTGGEVSYHKQQGIGDGFIPKNCDMNVVDDVVVVSDEDALAMAAALAKQEGLMVGISSGSNVWSAIEVAKKLGPGKRVVTVLPDTAERYYSTDLFKTD